MQFIDKNQARAERKQFRCDLGLHLAQVRTECGLSVSDVSVLLNRSGFYLEQLEKGKGDVWIHTLHLLSLIYHKKLVIRLE